LASRVTHLCLFVALTTGVLCAQSHERPKLSGFTVSTEGGIEGKQVIHYDVDGKAIDGNVPLSMPKAPRPTPPPAGEVVPQATEKIAKAAPAATSASMSTPDGRKLPFALEGGGVKRVDNNVDFDSSLKNFSKTSNLMEKRFETSQAPIGKEMVYSRENLLTLDTWHGKYDTIGRRRSDIKLEDTLGATVRAKDMIEVKSIEKTPSNVTLAPAEIKGIDARMTTERNSSYEVKGQSAADRLTPKSIDQLSMQDINRYQFRRNRSDEPGMPYVKPGSDQVQTKGSGGK